jgi:hypothetical protein
MFVAAHVSWVHNEAFIIEKNFSKTNLYRIRFIHVLRCATKLIKSGSVLSELYYAVEINCVLSLHEKRMELIRDSGNKSGITSFCFVFVIQVRPKPSYLMEYLIPKASTVKAKVFTSNTTTL